jgi:stearoyl-CoA desaturase (delta-9 desaturase)
MVQTAPSSSDVTPERVLKRDWVVGGALLGIHLVALCAFLPMFFSWQAVGVAVALWVVTGMGITLGYHRLLTHRSMVCPKWVEYLATIAGALALQGGPIEWVSQHRAHHAHSDTDGDPHTTGRGLRWAHIDWLFRRNKARLMVDQRARWVPDLVSDPGMRFIEKTNVLWTVALGFALFFLGGWKFVIWGIFARMVFTYHCTWMVNSWSHAYGYRTYKTTDKSTNNWLVAMLTFGEGWHNNHHAFPASAKHGMAPHEIDPTYYAIKVMSWLKLARKVNVPSLEARKRLEIKNNVRKIKVA